MKMKKVLVFGTFDGLHKGHLSFLRQAARHGNFLIAVVTRDSNVKAIKGRRPIQNEVSRLKGIRRFVDKVLLGERKVTYRLIKKIRPDVICIGYDQKPSMRETRVILKKIGMSYVKLRKMRPYMPQTYKSSKLRKLHEPR